MNAKKVALEGLELRFKVENGQVIFLDENRQSKATRPATPAELTLWGELMQLMGEHERVKDSLQKADEQTLRLMRILQRFPAVKTEDLQDPVSTVDEMLKGATELGAELVSFGAWLEREFPGEINGTEGITGTAARLLRGIKAGVTPKKTRQVGGMAVREAQTASEGLAGTPVKGAYEINVNYNRPEGQR
jgi:hypothetical protein